MALAQIALGNNLQSRVQTKLRGGGLLGSAIGAGIGIGAYLYENFDFTAPWTDLFEPGGTKKPGVAFVDATSQSTRSNQYHKTLRATKQRYRSKQRNRNNSHCSCCCKC